MRAFPLFLFELVDVIHAVTATAHVDVFSCYARLLEELNITHLFVANKDRLLQVEVDNYDDFFRCAWLEETMLDIAKAHVHFLALCSDETAAVLLDLEVSERLLSEQVWSDD